MELLQCRACLRICWTDCVQWFGNAQSDALMAESKQFRANVRQGAMRAFSIAVDFWRYSKL